MDASNQKHITLLELQQLIKRELERALPLTYWIVAEVSEIKVNYSGHCYMQLVEKGGKKEQPQASASAVAWRSSYGSIAAHFRAATGGEIAPGMKLLLRVSVNFHELYGLSLVVSDIDPSFTLGDIEQQRQQTITRLQQEGIFEMNRELAIPAFVQRIAVISSRNAAGYQDFMKEIEGSGYHFDIALFDAYMQGDAAEGTIIAALDAIAETIDDFDAVAIIRGGGSQSDLSCFNSYRLCAHIAQFPLPVITGIGHDKDRSVADMVAAVELKTPTAAANYLIELMAEEEAMLDAMKSRILQYAAGIFDTEKRTLREQSIELMRATSAISRLYELRLSAYQVQVAHKAQSALERAKYQYESAFSSIRERSAYTIEKQKTKLTLLSGLAESRDPKRIMAMGFAIVKTAGKTLTDSRHIAPGESIEVTLAAGKLTANVEKTE